MVKEFDNKMQTDYTNLRTGKNGTNGHQQQQHQKFIVKYQNKFYDITKFLQKHPGGIGTLNGLSNNDMTARFMSAPKHSDAAMYLMQEYEIRPTKANSARKDGEHDLIDAKLQENGIELITEEQNNNQLDDSMEHLVDWSQAMVPQIPRIAQFYNEWVHKPVDRPLRLFGPTYLEMFTKTPWWLIPVFWTPIITYCVWNEFSRDWHSKSTGELAFLSLNFMLGIAFWTLLEYVLHRFVFHMQLDANTNPWLCTFHFMIHGLHHKVPFDADRLVFPPLPGAIIAAIIYAPLSVLMPNPRLVLGGALLGYLCYDLMHYYLHYGNPNLGRTRFMYTMKRYHYQHHFAHQDMGYGISSPIWDIVFNTRIRLRELRYQLRWK